MAELGALEAMAVQGAQEAMVELGALVAMAELAALEAMADGLRGPWPRSGPYSRNSYYPPQKKKSLGKWGGIRSPPGLNRQDSTKQDRKALQGQTDKTGQPTGTGSPPGLARRRRLLLGMTRSQRPTQGPSATASTSATRGQAARMASMATTRGAACPRRVSMDLTWHGKLKCSCGHNKTDIRHSWPWHVDLIHGARDSGGHESAAIRRAWVSGDTAGIESAAIRRASSQRRAGAVISRERRAWGSGNPGTRQPAGGLGRATAGGGYLPRSAGMRARGQWTRGTRGDPAELPRRTPTPTCSGLWRE